MSNSVSQPNRLICSYFEEQWDTSHIDEIKDRGFSTVLFCLTEDQVAERAKYPSEVIRYAGQIGLERWTDLSSFGDVFTGTATSPFAEKQAGCMRNPNFLNLVKQGIKFAKNSGSEAMYWNEPHFDACSCCKGKEVALVSMMSDFAGRLNMQNSVCLDPSQEHMDGLELLASNRSIQHIATDSYTSHIGGSSREHYEGSVRGYASHVANIAEASGKSSHVWVQGFDIAAGDEDLPLIAANATLDGGVSSLGFWGFRACAAMPEIQPENPQKVWDNAGQLRTLLLGDIAREQA